MTNTKDQTPLSLSIDWEKYLGQLGDWNIPDDQKTEFIATLWGLLLNFAELGYEIHPAQDAMKAGQKITQKQYKESPEKSLKPAENMGFLDDDVLYSGIFNRTQIITSEDVQTASMTEESECKETPQ